MEIIRAFSGLCEIYNGLSAFFVRGHFLIKEHIPVYIARRSGISDRVTAYINKINRISASVVRTQKNFLKFGGGNLTRNYDLNLHIILIGKIIVYFGFLISGQKIGNIIIRHKYGIIVAAFGSAPVKLYRLKLRRYLICRSL